MRKMWLQNPTTGEIWDLLPENPYDINNGCAFLSVKGVGYKQKAAQEQVEIDYFITSISSENQPITGIFYFNGDEHVENFQKYIGDFRKQFLLYFSPSGEYEPYDKISSPWYKPVVITQVDKEEKNEYGWYDCSITFSTQSDVWKRDVSFSIEGNSKNVGESLVYPYTYEHVLGGRDIYGISIQNAGRETGCIVIIKNNSENPVSELEWLLENTHIDHYGIEQKTVQRSKWYTANTDVTLSQGYELYVDSNPITQEAKVTYPDGTSQSVVAWQEPSWEYINFVRIKNGYNKFIFYVDGKDVTISVEYQEQKEII